MDELLNRIVNPSPGSEEAPLFSHLSMSDASGSIPVSSLSSQGFVAIVHVFFFFFRRSLASTRNWWYLSYTSSHLS
jgi:hypothetical protein